MTSKKSLLAAAAAVVTLAIAGSAGAATIVNGGFAGPTPADGSFQQVNGAGVIAGWTVTGGNVDWIKGYWQSSDGDGFSIDLNGSAPGAISQTIDTVAGQAYHLTFDMSANPDNGSALRLLLADTGGAATSFSYDLDTALNSHGDMNWVGQSLDFVATGASTTITFASGSGGANCCYGPAIDNVAIANAVPEPATWALMLTGFFGLGAAVRRAREPVLVRA